MDDEPESGDYSQHFASWIWEICESLSLIARFDATNLSRILDERKLKNDVLASRVLIGIISSSALLDPHGMYQELQWAEAANVPIIPFYNGDQHFPEEYSRWRDEYSFLKRAPVVYQRRTHLRVKDTLVVALQEAIHDSYKAAGVHMPPTMANLLDRQAERAQRRQKRAARVATEGGALGSPQEGATARSEADKRFRFRDELNEDGPTGGVSRLMKTLKDPMGWKEQEMRTALLQDEHEVDDEEGKHVPKHRSLKPSGGILRGSADAPSPAKSVSAAAQMSLDPKMQQGVVRVKEYLDGVRKDDAGQLPTILKILQLMQPNLEVACRALELTFEFSRGEARCRQLVAQNDGIKAIVNAMAAHTDSMALQMHGCGCLYALSCFRAGSPDKDTNSVRIAHAGGIARLLFALDCYPHCQEVQQWAGGALRHLAIEIGDNRREVLQDGEVQLTMRGINRRMITKSGGIELLVRGMLGFPNDLEIQENGCAALCNLIANRHDTKVRAARSGSIRAVILSMKNFPFEPELTQMACAVLRSLALGVPENKVSIVAQGGIRQLCEAMARHRTNADVNMQAIAALCNLTSHFAENKRAICEAGGLEMAIAALLMHPDSQELQQQGNGLLHNLACEDGLRPQLIAAGALRVAEAAMQHPARSVQSLGQMLKRQLQSQAVEKAEAKVVGTFPKEAASGVEELFAPRTHGVRVARSKALTRPQRKVMADVIASMQRNPREWLPRDGSSASGDDLLRSEASSGGHSERSNQSGQGKWDLKEKKRAAAYGIEDLEEVSDNSASVASGDDGLGAFAFMVRRGLTKPREDKSDRFQARSTAPRGMQLELEEPVSGPVGPVTSSRILPLTMQNLKAREKLSSDLTPSGSHVSKPSGDVAAAEADPAKMETGSAVSDATSEGGWIDDLEDPRLEKRVKRQQKKLQRQLDNAEDTGILDDIFGEVELEGELTPVKAARPQVKKNRDFARALKKCGEVAPERFDESWEEALSTRVLSRGSSGFSLTRSASSSSLINELDGLGRLRKVSSAVKQGLQEVKSLAARVQPNGQREGQVTGKPTAESAKPDEGYSYGIDAQDVGQAEVALLGALGPKATASTGEDPSVRPSREALRLEALSRQLEQKRSIQRRVQLL